MLADKDEGSTEIKSINLQRIGHYDIQRNQEGSQSTTERKNTGCIFQGWQKRAYMVDISKVRKEIAAEMKETSMLAKQSQLRYGVAPWKHELLEITLAYSLPLPLIDMKLSQTLLPLQVIIEDLEVHHITVFRLCSCCLVELVGSKTISHYDSK